MRKNVGGITCRLKTPEKDCGYEKLKYIEIDQKLCTGCGRCKEHCPTAAISGLIGHPHEIQHVEACIHCGMCLIHCPEGAIYENYSWLNEVREQLANNKIATLAFPSPAIRHSFAENHFIQGAGASRLRGALNTLGFDHCFDVQFGADATIMEEGKEFVQRIQRDGPWPLMSSCCPAWVRYAETFFPEILPCLSNVKSPLMIAGRIAKKYAIPKLGLDPDQCYSVAITPCIAKKYEIQKDAYKDNERDFDAALTTREFQELLKGLNHKLLPSLSEDKLMGQSSGSSAKFCIGGGVTEAILRYAAYAVEGKDTNVNLGRKMIREGITELSLTMDGMNIRCASVQGAKHFASICNDILEKRKTWHFVEFMACPGGCVNGGGQPLNVFH